MKRGIVILLLVCILFISSCEELSNERLENLKELTSIEGFEKKDVDCLSWEKDGGKFVGSECIVKLKEKKINDELLVVNYCNLCQNCYVNGNNACSECFDTPCPPNRGEI